MNKIWKPEKDIEWQKTKSHLDIKLDRAKRYMPVGWKEKMFAMFRRIDITKSELRPDKSKRKKRKR